MYTPPSVHLPCPPVVSSFSRWCIGAHRAGVGPTVPVSTAWGSANRAVFYPFMLPGPGTALKMFVMNGATINGNVDVGIYDAAGNRLVSAGSTAQSGANALQVFDITDTELAAGVNYYMALASSSSTATFFADAQSRGRALPVLFVASGFALPSTATLVGQQASTGNFATLFGISFRSLLT